VELDDPRAGQPREALRIGEVPLEDERDPGAQQLRRRAEEQLPRDDPEPPRLGDRPRREELEERLLEVVLGDERQPQLLRERPRQRRLPRPRRPRDDDEERPGPAQAASRRST
jgi:hypothetical protein